MSRHIGNPLGSKEFLNEAKKFTKRDFSKLTKQEVELLSMGFAMFADGGPAIDAKNIHFVTPQGLKQTLKGFEKEKRGMSPQGKKLLDSIMKKTKPLVEQVGMRDDEEEMKRILQMAKQKMSRVMPKKVGDSLQQTGIRPMETGAPGAMSADIGWKELAGIAKPQDGMGMTKPPMQGGMGMPKPPMQGGMPPMQGGMPPMDGRPPAPTMDDQPGLPMKPSAPPQEGGMPPMGGGPPKESEGPRAMEPAPDFAERMGIVKHQRHHLRPEEDTYPMQSAKPGAAGGPPGPGMPGMPPGPPRSSGPQQGQPVRPELASDPAAPKEMPQLSPGTTEGSQDFIKRYAGQIKSFLKQILDKEKRKFALGKDLTAMPKNFKESANPYGRFSRMDARRETSQRVPTSLDKYQGILQGGAAMGGYYAPEAPGGEKPNPLDKWQGILQGIGAVGGGGQAAGGEVTFTPEDEQEAKRRFDRWNRLRKYGLVVDEQASNTVGGMGFRKKKRHPDMGISTQPITKSRPDDRDQWNDNWPDWKKKKWIKLYGPPPMREQASNAVGGGMSPVIGGEGEIEGRDKMLGKTGDKQDKFSMMRRASDALDIQSQRNY